MKKIMVFAAMMFGLACLAVYPQHSSVLSLEKTTMDVAEKFSHSVVSISSIVKERASEKFYFGSPFGEFEDDMFREFFEEFFGEYPEREFERMGLGSGVIIDQDGYILTNEHVISGATQIKVKLPDGREFNAEVKGADNRSDLAIIKIDAKGLPVAELGDSDSCRLGEWVVAVGNPFGFAIENPEPTITVGVISALHRSIPALGKRDRSYDDLLQTDAAINPGNSGGPLVNLQGKVIGINTAIITTTGGYQGLGFAIPINKAKNIMDKLIRGEKVLYGWLGVSIQDLNEDLRSYFAIKETEGVIVVKIYKDSPAEKGGLKEGDLILSFNNSMVKTARDLVRMVSASEVGKVFPLEIVRLGQRKTLDITVEKTPKDLLEGVESSEVAEQENKAVFRGLEVADLTTVYKRRYAIEEKNGVVITYVENNSAAEKAGLVAGDVIVKIENKVIENKENFTDATSKIQGSCLIKTNRGYFVIK